MVNQEKQMRIINGFWNFMMRWAEVIQDSHMARAQQMVRDRSWIR
jgi:hypothetical protein